MDRADILRRVQEYAQREGLVVSKPLGSGIHGSVYAAEYQTKGGRTALKGHGDEQPYCRERDVYLRLRERGVSVICGCNVPELIDFDDQLLIIEMTIVIRPFIVDFAGATLDHPVDFPEDVLADWRAEKQEQFGPHWPHVQVILGSLEILGVFLTDINPGNIAFND